MEVLPLLFFAFPSAFLPRDPPIRFTFALSPCKMMSEIFLQEEEEMHTEDMVLSFTLERDCIRAALIGEGGEELLSGLCPGTAKISPESLQAGLQEAFKALAEPLEEPLRKVRGLVIHDRLKGFMPFDRNFSLLGPYRGRPEEDTEAAAAYLSSLFETDLSPDAAIVHLYQAMRMGESSLDFLNHICTPRTWLYRKLTGEFAADRADAGDIFPLLPDGTDYDPDMETCFNALAEADGYPWRVQHLLPQIREAGQPIGTLTPEGAFFIDPGCRFKPGIPVLG